MPQFREQVAAGDWISAYRASRGLLYSAHDNAEARGVMARAEAEFPDAVPDDLMAFEVNQAQG